MDEFSEQLSSSSNNLVDKLTDWLNMIILQLPNLAIALVVASIAYFSSKYIKRFAVNITKRVTKNQTVLNLVSNLASVIFGVAVLFMILSIFNLSGTINKILATAGVIGLAVGLALQDPMNNLFSGVFMSVKKLYQIGDLVDTNGYFGTITDIDLRNTKLRLPTGQDVIIPNKDVLQNPMKNYSSSGERRVDISCGVSYGDNLQKTEDTIIKTLEKLDYRMKNKPVEILFNEFGGSSINFDARFWIEVNGQKDYLKAKSNAIKAIKQALDQADIMIPYPITTLDFGIRGGISLKEEIGESAQLQPY